jgi:hypothetical protein
VPDGELRAAVFPGATGYAENFHMPPRMDKNST